MSKHTKTEIKNAEKDIQQKVNGLLKSVVKESKVKMKNYFKENTYAQEQHIKEGGGYFIPKDFLMALLMEAADSYSCAGCSDELKRKSKKHVRKISQKLYSW